MPEQDASQDLSERIRWTTTDAFELNGVRFLSSHYGADRATADAQGAIWVMKGPDLLALYGSWVGEPRTIVEIGVAGGGGAALLNEAYAPDKLVAIDLQDTTTEAFKRYCEGPRGGAIARYLDVDQSNQNRLDEIVATEIGDAPLDLVIDDASHFYEPSVATFETLFPRLRPGGVYVLEDWGWAHWPGELWQGRSSGRRGQTSLTNMVHQIVMASASNPRWVERIMITSAGAVFVRGPDAIGPRTPLQNYYINRGRPFRFS